MTTQYIYDLVDTWNDGATTFTSIKMDVTDTASNAASLLMDLQVGGASQIGVAKAKSRIFGVQSDTGGVSISTTATSTSFLDVVGGSTFHYVSGNIVNSVNRGGTKGFSTTSDGFFSWGSSTTSAGNPGDLLLTRRGTANLRLGAADAAAPVAQTLSVQSVVAGTTNTAGTNLTITGSQGTGNAAGGSIIFQVAPAGSSGSAQNALVTALTLSHSGGLAATFPGLIITGNLQVSSNQIQNYGGIALGLNPIGNNVGVGLSNPSQGFTVKSDYGIAWDNGSGTADTILRRDAANTLALRNGTAAQAFRVYNTYTDATTFERANIFWDSNVLKIGTEKGSVGGTARALEFQTDGATRLTIPSNGGVWTASGQFFHFRASANTSASIISPSDGVMTLGNWNADNFNRLQFGGTSASFPALKRNGTALETKLADDTAYAPHAMQYLDVTDGVTAPASATGRARIYVDTADGDLKVIFADGTVKTIVTDT